MSLINKMLQDLDARGSQAGAALPGEVRSVPLRERTVSTRTTLIAAAGTLVVVVAGVYGWNYLQVRSWSVTPPLRAPIALPPVAPAPAAVILPVPASTPAPAPEPLPAPAPPVPGESVTAALAEAPPPRAKPPAETRVAPQKNIPVSDKPAPPPPLRTTVVDTPKAIPVSVQEAQLSAQRIAENEYRRALSALQEGRVSEAVDHLQQGLLEYPRHGASRETLIRLLLENKRQDEAIVQLRLSLGIDPKQPAMAMMLARLQLEKGGPAINTLMRTLPYATDNGEYLAFLAALYQRAQHHREAAEQYQQALLVSPKNALWWMGLGISLQADKRPTEAADAYTRALAQSSLSPDLQAFVERKLQQVKR